MMIIVEYLPETIFLLLLILLAVVPKKKKWIYLWCFLFISNIVVRIYLIHENHNKAQKVSKLENEINIEKRTIRDFESELKVRFSGEWVDKPYPGRIISPVNDEYYIVLNSSDMDFPNPVIRFYATQAYSFRDIDDHCASFESRQAVHKGDYPISSMIDELYSYDTIDIHILFIPTLGSEGPKITIEEVEILFFINGKKCDNIVFHESREISIGSGYASFRLILQDPILNLSLNRID